MYETKADDKTATDLCYFETGKEKYMFWTCYCYFARKKGKK